MPESIIFLVIALPVVLLFASLYWLDRVRRREALFRWASSNGYRLLFYGQPVLTEASPFPVAASKAQHVFRVEIEDRAGARRKGWVRVGSPLRGLSSATADVHWTAA